MKKKMIIAPTSVDGKCIEVEEEEVEPVKKTGFYGLLETAQAIPFTELVHRIALVPKESNASINPKTEDS